MNQRKEQLDVYLDMDGVIADTEGVFCHRFGNERRHLYNWYERYPDKAGEIEAFTDDRSTYFMSEPLPLGVSIARWLMERVTAYGRRQNRAKVTILTSRPFRTYDVTKKWLKGENIPYHQLEFSSTKVQWMKEHQPDIIVDDMLEICMGVPPGTVPVLVRHPWNETPFIPRITTLEQFQRIYREVALAKLFDDSGGTGMAEDILSL